MRRLTGGIEPIANQVLLVESVREVRESIALYLSDKGFAVVEAEDGREALYKLISGQASGPFLALIADIDMPRMSGENLVLEVDARGLDFEAYLIISSHARGHAEVQRLITARVRVPLRIFEKPFVYDDLWKCLVAIQERQKQEWERK